MYEKNHRDKEDHTWRIHMQTLKTMKLIVEIDEKLPGIIDEWYMRKGEPTPLWRNKKPYFDDDGNIVRPE